MGNSSGRYLGLRRLRETSRLPDPQASLLPNPKRSLQPPVRPREALAVPIRSVLRFGHSERILPARRLRIVESSAFFRTVEQHEFHQWITDSGELRLLLELTKFVKSRSS